MLVLILDASNGLAIGQGIVTIHSLDPIGL